MFHPRSRAALIGVLVAVATPGLMLAPQAASAAARTYTATISPPAAQLGSTATYTFTITTASQSGSPMGKKTFTITVPSAFTMISVGAPSPSSWTASRSGNAITLTSRQVPPGGSVSVPITASAPAAPGSYTWVTSASGLAGTFTRVGPDPSVTVAQQASVVVCPSNMSCTSSTLSAGPTSTNLATDSQVTAQSGAQPDLLSVVLPDPTASPMRCEQVNDTFGQIVTWHVTSRTSTLTYTVYPTDPNYTYDLSDTCFGSTQPFPGAVQNPQNGNEYEGSLQSCSTNAPPCVESIVSTTQDTDNDGDPGDTGGDDTPIVIVTVDAPKGDPKFSG